MLQEPWLLYAQFLLPMLLPPLFLAAALIFTRGRRLWVRTISTGLALLVSLPVGLVAEFAPMGWMTYDPNHEHSPGIGVAAIPLVFAWAICVVLWFFGSAVVLLARLTRARNEPH